MHETAIDGDGNIERDFSFTPMWSNSDLSQLVTCKQNKLKGNIHANFRQTRRCKRYPQLYTHMGTIDNIILNIMDLMICARWQLTAKH